MDVRHRSSTRALGRRRLASAVAIGMGLAAGLATTAWARSPAPDAGSSAAAAARVAVTGLPLAFETNVGQTDDGAQFLAHGSSYAIALTGDAAVLSLAQGPEAETPDVLRLEVVGARGAVRPSAEAPLPGRVNYIIGSDPTRWHTGVATYGRVRYAGVYPGVDLVYYGTEGRLEYDLVVAPGASATPIQLRFDGADTVRVDGQGGLKVATHGREISFERPVAYQTVGGRHRPVSATYRIDGNNVQFDLGAYDHARALVIDPVLSYLTYLGGSGADVIGGQTPQSGSTAGQAAALDAAGGLYVAGYTQSTNFPTRAPFATAPAKTGGTWWAFVSKIAPDGKSLVYSTYFGGATNSDLATAVAVDKQGNAFVVGYTNSNDFPVTTGAYQTICSPNYTNSPNNPFANCTGGQGNGPSSAFVTKLGPTGGLLASTFLGSGYGSAATSVAVDSAGRPYVAGYAYPGENVPVGVGGQNQAVGFPTTSGAVLTAFNYVPNVAINGTLNQDAFVTVFDPALTTLVYSTLFGDTQPAAVGANRADTRGAGVAVDAAGNFYLAGTTADAFIPTTPGVVQPTISSCGASFPGSTTLNGICGFVAKFSPVGTAAGPTLTFGTYLGGEPPSVTANLQDLITGIAVDAAGDAYVTGFTNVAGFPTTAGSYQTTCDGYTSSNTGNSNCNAAFVAKLNPSGTSLLASTYFGCVTCSGDGLSSVGAIALDPAGNVYFTGIGGNSLTQVGGFTTNNGGAVSPFIAELDSGLQTLKFMTLLNVGGAGQMSTGGLALDSSNNIYLAGNVNSPATSAATSGAFQSAYGGGSSDGFIAKITVTAVTKTTLSASPTSAVAGASVTFTATVTETSGTAVPTGTVTFNSGTTALGTGTLNAAGVATYTTSKLVAGSYTVTAAYGGDSANNASTSGVVTETITAPSGTTTTLAASSASVASGASVTFTATVAPASGTTVPTGTVTFANGATTLGTGPLNGSGVATLTTAALPIGAAAVTAAYGGDASDNASTSAAVTVAVAPLSPTGLTATAGNGTVTLSWGTVTGATSYAVYQGTSAGGEAKAAVATPASAAATISGLTNGTAYYFTVAAVGGGVTGAASGEASATPTAPASGGGGSHGGGGAMDLKTLAVFILLFGLRAAGRARAGRAARSG